MQIPRPDGDTGLGFHYYPDDLHYREIDLNAWLPELAALRASWITLRTSPARAAPEAFVRGLIEAGIEPIVHIRPAQIASPDPHELESLVGTYARWGVRYIVFFDRPNARDMWPVAEFHRAALVERFLDRWLPVAHVVRAHGLPAIFPPLEQGGTYWDTSFLGAALTALKQRRQEDVLANFIIGCYAFAGTQRPDYGAGGPAAWPNSRPYRTPLGSQDQRGFRSFEWYAANAAERLGMARPVLMLAGGARLGETDPTNGDIIDDTWHAACNIEIARQMLERKYPDYLLNVNFWLLAADTPAGGRSANRDGEVIAAWYRPDGSTVGAVAELKKMARKQRSSPKSRPKAPNGGPKILKHYLLLPCYDGVASGWHWNLVGDIVRTYQPACGFSPDEARHARYVTLVGDERGVSREVEEQLRRSGCLVERVAAEDPVDAHKAVAEAAEAVHNGALPSGPQAAQG